MKNVRHVLSVQAGRCFELDHALGTPGDSKSSGMEHKKVIGTITNSNGLSNWDVVFGGNRLQELTLLTGVDDRV
jgi:hypothetical protein